MQIHIGFDFQQFGIGLHIGRGRVTIMLAWLFITLLGASHDPSA